MQLMGSRQIPVCVPNAFGGVMAYLVAITFEAELSGCASGRYLYATSIRGSSFLLSFADIWPLDETIIPSSVSAAADTAFAYKEQ